MNDYNIRMIKIDLFFFNFALNYTINALFFNDSTMHQISEDEGDYNFVYQIPQIMYSSLITIVIFSILRLLALTESDVIDIKHQKDTKKLLIKKDKTLRIMKIKFLFFNILSVIIYFLCFYFLACFCAIYNNTQIHLIKDTLTSFGFSLLYPIFIYLLPGFVRIPSLNDEKIKREILYKFSKIIQMF